MVGSVYYEPPGKGADAIVLIDPLVPSGGPKERERFLDSLDADAERSRLPVAILIGNRYHSRSSQEIYDRYRQRRGSSIWAPHTAKDKLKCAVTNTFGNADALPNGVGPFLIEGLDDPEVVFHIPTYRALVFSDSLIGVSNHRVRVAPASWGIETPAGQENYRKHFRKSFRPLLKLDVDLLLVSHGPPVLNDGKRELAEALEAQAWGEDTSF